MQVEYKPDTITDQKRAAILKAAMQAFAQYGFRRVSMAEIARGVGMSRAALYLHFRNKEDIYSSIVEDYFIVAARRIEAELQSADTPTDALAAAFRAKLAAPFDMLMESRHGPELLDAKSAIASPIVARGNAALIDVFTDWLKVSVASGQVVLGGESAEDVAGTILAAVHGVVDGATNYAALLQSTDRLAALFGRALTPR